MVSTDAWLSRAVHVAAATHRDGFMEAYTNENEDFEEVLAKMKSASDEMARPGYDDSSWDEMEVPGLIPDDMDGVVWFRKTIDYPAEYMDEEGRLYLHAIDDSDITWLNGIKIGSMQDSRDIRRYYRVTNESLKPGKNVIAVKLTDRGGPGGFLGNYMFLGTSEGRVPLMGPWKYKITREFKGGEESVGSLIADNFMLNYWDVETTQEQQAQQVTGREIRISSVQNKMKYSLEEFEVAAGETVTVVFNNPDFMQHNLLILKPGTLEKVGQFADELATIPNGVDQGYVPDVPEVLFSTALVDPDGTVNLTFTVPDEPGNYPFVCTFPGHWRTMNGVMVVTSKDPS
ncbi:MAG: hypothetical protein JXQ90_15795 [Cyclobacteriaceae bacterium]